MISCILPDFDIEQIAASGQCFRFRRQGEGRYSLIAGGKRLEIEQNGDTVGFSCGEDEFEAFWRNYFDLNADYGRYKAKVALRDSYLQAAVQTGSGLRILRQDVWETVICFIISQQNNIPRITKCVENLCALFGEQKVNARGETYYAFPTAERLAQCTPDDLAPVSCLEDGAEPCQRVGQCRTIRMWNEFQELVNHYFDSITLADLVNEFVREYETEQNMYYI